MTAGEIPGAIEKAAHAAMRELAQQIWDQHGLCIKKVNISWMDVSTVANRQMLATEVSLDTMTKG